MNPSNPDAPHTIPPEAWSPPRPRANWRFMLAHPAHGIALAGGAGLSPVAPGTVGTAWAWLSFTLLSPYLTDMAWALLIALSLPLGWWASTTTARNLDSHDPSCVVWDEVVAFWLVLWLITPCSWQTQLAAFLLFRWLDAVKPHPVAWADQLFAHTRPDHDPHAWRKAGFGIMLDDAVAAACTLLLIALWRFAL